MKNKMRRYILNQFKLKEVLLKYNRAQDFESHHSFAKDAWPEEITQSLRKLSSIK